MITNYVIFDRSTRLFVREGSRLRFTYALNNAKHLTSEWNAQNFIKRYKFDLEGFEVIKVQR